MRSKKSLSGCVCILLVLLAGCKKDEQVATTLAELDSFTQKLLQSIESAPIPAQGLDAARAYFDANQADLRSKMKELSSLRGYQVSEEARKQLEQSLTKNITTVYSLKIKMMGLTMQDKVAGTKLDQLIDDYTALVKGEAAGTASNTSSTTPVMPAKSETTPVVSETGPKQGGNELRGQLKEVLGDDSSWKATVFSSLRLGMTCDETRKLFPELGVCDSTKSFDFLEVSVKNHPVVSRYKFSFKEGTLYDATLIFRRSLNYEEFKSASLDLFEKKWGAIPPEKRDQEILTAVGPGFVLAQRSEMMNEWHIKHGFPKNE